MKKILLLALVLITLNQANAQEKCFQKGNVLLNPGVGLVHNYGFGGFGAFGTFGGNRFRPSVFFSADIGVHDYVSVGPYAGATFFNGATGIDFGARGNFHWWQLLDDKVDADLKQSQFEIYATLWLGGELITGNSNSIGSFDIGFSQGVRWYPKSNKRFALYGEFGYTPIAYATIGATIKIGK